MVQKIEKKKIKLGKISEKYCILKLEEKRIAFIGNKEKRSFVMTTKQRYIEARRLNESKIQIIKRIEKEKLLSSDTGGGNMLKVLTGEEPKCYFKK